MRLIELLGGRDSSSPVLIDQRQGALVLDPSVLDRTSTTSSTALVAPSSAYSAVSALLALDGRVARLVLGAAKPPDLESDAVVIDDTWNSTEGLRGHADDSCTPSYDTEWVFATSGTTGAPKFVAHRLESLLRTARRRTEDFVPRWGLLYGWSRFAGIQVILQSLASGGTLLTTDPGSNLEEQVAFLARGGCDHLSATPTLWRKLLMTRGSRSLDLRQITLGGEIADQRTIDALQAAFPNAQVTHVFAATESGAAFAVRDGREGFPASFLETPPRGIELDVRDGRLFVRNELVRPKYLGTEQTLAVHGWVDTGDEVELRGDRYVFLGRRSGTVNVGGSKFHPETLERAVMAHPSVALARATTRPNPIVGALVVLEVVATSDGERDGLAKSVLLMCRRELPRHMVPGKVLVVDELPVNEGGKMIRS